MGLRDVFVSALNSNLRGVLEKGVVESPALSAETATENEREHMIYMPEPEERAIAGMAVREAASNVSLSVHGAVKPLILKALDAGKHAKPIGGIEFPRVLA